MNKSASRLSKIETVVREISELSGVKFVKDDPILFPLASILTAIEENKTGIISHKKEILNINKEILNLLKEMFNIILKK